MPPHKAQFMRKMKITALLTAFTLMWAASAMAERADYNVIPLPKSVQSDSTKTFALKTGLGIAYDASDPEIARNAQFLRTWGVQVGQGATPGTEAKASSARQPFHKALPP